MFRFPTIGLSKNNEKYMKYRIHCQSIKKIHDWKKETKAIYGNTVTRIIQTWFLKLSFHLNYSPTVSLSINNAAQCYRNIKLTRNDDVKRYYW